MKNNTEIFLTKKTKRKYIILIFGIGILFGISFWIIDSIIDFYFFRDFLQHMLFERYETILESMITNPSAHEIYTRITFFGACIVFSVVIYRFYLKITKNQENLIESEEKLSLTIEGGELGTWFWDIETGEVEFNERWAGMLGYSLSEIEQKVETWDKHIHPDDRDLVYSNLNDHLNGNTDHYEVEHRLKNKNNNWIWVLDKGKVTKRDEDGKPLKAYGTHLDITKRKEAEFELKRINAELEEAVNIRTRELLEVNKELESFTYSASHDLRAPLRSIEGFSKIILEDNYEQMDEESKYYFSRIMKATERMETLINDLLTLSRLSKKDLVKDEVDLSEIAKEIFAQLREKSPERNIKVNIEENMITIGDKNLITIAMENMFGNAWKFTSKEKTAIINIFSAKAEKTFCIEDNGVGFDQKYAEKTFKPFYRLHKEEDFEGTGIGLAIVHRIIHKHHGKINIEGIKNKGTKVFFSFERSD